MDIEQAKNMKAINAEKLIIALQEVFDKERFNTEAVYGGSSISIRDKSNTYVYLRIYHKEGSCIVDISNIELAKALRRKGYFTSLVNKMVALPIVESVIVSSVITEAMHEACKKNGFEPYEMYSGYIKYRKV